MERQRRRRRWRIQVDADDLIIRQQRQQAQSQIASNPGDQDSWLGRIHYLGPGEAGLADDGGGVMPGMGIIPRAGISGPK